MNYYDKISEGYDELHGEEQKKKLKIIVKHLRPAPSDKILDVGCGTGISSDLPGDVTGIDPSGELLMIAKKRGIKAIKGKAEALPFDDNSFDIVISLTAAQNFDDIKKGIKEIKRVSKGKVAVSILKKSRKIKEFKHTMENEFPGCLWIEEEKDLIGLVIQES